MAGRGEEAEGLGGANPQQSIASFYGTDFGRCLESFESFYRQKAGRDRNNTLSIVMLKRDDMPSPIYILCK
jgi:hypothetical protein